jgi:hypothetical protein
MPRALHLPGRNLLARRWTLVPYAVPPIQRMLTVRRKRRSAPPDMEPECKKGADIAPRTEPGIGIVGYVGVLLVVAVLLAIVFYSTTPQEA